MANFIKDRTTDYGALAYPKTNKNAVGIASKEIPAAHWNAANQSQDHFADWLRALTSGEHWYGVKELAADPTAPTEGHIFARSAASGNPERVVWKDEAGVKHTLSHAHVNIVDHGAVADWDGSTGTNNYTAWLAAITAAVTADVPLYIPPTPLPFFISWTDSACYSVANGTTLRVIGGGKGRSKIKYGPNDVVEDPGLTESHRLFDIVGSGTLYVSDLSIEGPDTVGNIAPLGDNGNADEGFVYPSTFYTQAGMGDVVLKNVALSKGSGHLTLSGPGCFADVTGCEIETFNIAIGSTENAGAFGAIGGAFTVPTDPDFTDLAVYTAATAWAKPRVEGKSVVIAGSTTSANNGTFVITRWISPYAVEYVNASAVAESFPGTITITIPNRFHCDDVTLATSTSHCAYFNWGTSTRFNNVTFQRSGPYGPNYFGMHFNAGAGTVLPEYCDFTRCYFGPLVTGKFLSNRYGLTTLTDCVFDFGATGVGVGISLAGNAGGKVVAVNPVFKGEGADGITTRTGEVLTSLEVTNADFSQFSGAEACLYMQPTEASSVWKFTGGNLGNSSADVDSQVILCNAEDSVRMEFHKVHFLADCGGYTYATFIAGGTFLYDGCRFTSTKQHYFVYGTGIDLDLTINNNIITGNRNGWFIDVQAGASVGCTTVKGKNNSFLDPSYLVAQLAGPLFNEAVAGAIVSRVEIRQDVDPNIRASATALNLHANWNTVHVSGTTAIVDINVYGSSNAVTNFFGPLYLIADAAWTMTAAGNIRPKTLAARTADTVYAFVCDPVARLWYEVG